MNTAITPITPWRVDGQVGRAAITAVLLLATSAFSAAQESPAAACAPNDPVCPPPKDAAGPDILTPGLRVRITTAALIEVPSVARLELRRFQGNDVSIDWKNGTVSLNDMSGGRLTLPQPNTVVVGEVISSSEGTLVVRLDGRPVQVSIPRAAIEEMSTSLGRKKNRSRLKTALAGAAMGGAGGFILGHASGDDVCKPPAGVTGFEALFSCLFTYTAEEKAKLAGVFFGALGGVVGVFVGGGETERWSPPSSPRKPGRVAVSIRPTGRTSAQFAVSF